MNHEFEWRNQMRKLGGPVEPARDLWPAIAARLEGAATRTGRARRRRVAWIAIAASLLVAFGAGLGVHRWQRSPASSSPDATVAAVSSPTTPAAAARTPRADTEAPRTPLDWAVPDDPALAATAQHLDDASAQLQDALEQRPDAVFLVGILNRTNAMRLRLMRRSPHST
jgi:hypothetical protein